MKRLLIVEDDISVRDVLREIFKKESFIVDETDKGSEAMDRVSSVSYDLVIIDLVLPDADGLDILSWIRKKTPKTKIIMISAFGTIEVAVNAIKKGADNFIPKPFRPSDILTVAKRTLEEARFDSTADKVDIDCILKTISNPTKREIIKLLHAEQRMHLLDIARRLSIDDHTKVSFHLRILKGTGIVSQDRERAYHLTWTGEEAIQFLKMLCERFRKDM